MRFGEVVVHDIWMQGKKILLVVDINYVSGLVLEYVGKLDLYGLKRKIKCGEKFLAGLSRDYQYIALREEATFEFCA